MGDAIFKIKQPPNVIFLKYTYCSLIRSGCGMAFAESDFDLCSTVVTVVLYGILCWWISARMMYRQCISNGVIFCLSCTHPLMLYWKMYPWDWLYKTCWIQHCFLQFEGLFPPPPLLQQGKGWGEVHRDDYITGPLLLGESAGSWWIALKKDQKSGKYFYVTKP